MTKGNIIPQPSKRCTVTISLTSGTAKARQGPARTPREWCNGASGLAMGNDYLRFSAPTGVTGSLVTA